MIKLIQLLQLDDWFYIKKPRFLLFSEENPKSASRLLFSNKRTFDPDDRGGTKQRKTISPCPGIRSPGELRCQTSIEDAKCNHRFETDVKDEAKRSTQTNYDFLSGKSRFRNRSMQRIRQEIIDSSSFNCDELSPGRPQKRKSEEEFYIFAIVRCAICLWIMYEEGRVHLAGGIITTVSFDSVDMYIREQFLLCLQSPIILSHVMKDILSGGWKVIETDRCELLDSNAAT
ncbi:hypothetical protein NPIL_208301 [Nephila pilipes]|uniref:Uncharacterized protein n=1 Tax=Nephila pilipes TaxID=299642 RepID=A0A8X6NJW2_NEPPI|nr:hypothetical protein NPIL_208301 [Nephila pilipes]